MSYGTSKVTHKQYELKCKLLSLRSSTLSVEKPAWKLWNNKHGEIAVESDERKKKIWK
jgi:hypothetical protein